MKAVPVLLLAAAGFIPALGFAQTRTISDSFEVTARNVLTGFSLDRFDSSRGTLDSVNFSYELVTSGAATFAFDNDSKDSGVYGKVTTTLLVGAFSITDDDVKAALAAFSGTLQGEHIRSYYTEVALAANDGDSTTVFNVGGADYAELTFFQNQVLHGFSVTMDSGLDAFLVSEGKTQFTGSTRASFDALSGFSPTVEGDYIGRLDSVTLRGTVTYNYTAIPEPTTYALILGALTLGLVGWRRFRK